MGLNIEQSQRMYPERFDLNLQAKRSKTGDVDFSMPSLNYPYLMELAKRVFSSSYQPGTGTFEYRDPEFRTYDPQIDWGKVFINRQRRFPESIGSGVSL